MDIKLAEGHRTEPRSNVRTWFQWLDQDRQLRPLKECPALSRVRRYAGASFGGHDTLMVGEYRVREPIELMLVSTGAAFGKLRMYVNLHLKLDPDDSLIDVHGLGTYGGFHGNASIGPMSVVSSGGVVQPVTAEMLVNRFGYVQHTASQKKDRRRRCVMY